MIRKFGNDISGIDNKIVGLDYGIGVGINYYTKSVNNPKKGDWIDISLDAPLNGISYLVNDARDASYGFIAVTSDSNKYQVDWGDGTILLYTSSSKATHTYTTIGQMCSMGYSTFKVKITPVTGNLLSCNIADNGSGLVTQYHGILWCYVKTNTLINTSYMFYNSTGCYCQQLEIFEADDTINVTSMNNMFANCYALITVPLFNTINVTDMSYMFNGCRLLSNLPLFNTINVTNMSYMFNGCRLLSIVPLLNTINVTNMNNMFNGCRLLSIVPLLNTINVTNMSYMFANCYALITVPLFNTINVTNMSYMFNGCSVLSIVPLFNTSNVTSMSYMFNGCRLLSTIPLLNTINVTNMSYMFNSCSVLSIVPLLNTINVTNMNNMFNSCSVLSIVPLLNTINVTNMNNMFTNCYALITVPLFNTINVTNISYMFNSCSVLSIVPLFNTINVTSMSNMFNGCSVLSIVPLFNTINVTSMSNMFTNCYSLTGFIVNGGVFSGATPQIGLDNSGLNSRNINTFFTSLPNNIRKSISVIGTIGNIIKSLSGTTILSSDIITMSNTDGLIEGMEIRGSGISSPVAVTFTITTNVITKTNHGLTDGKLVYFPTIVNTIGLTVYTPYYVINRTTNTFNVALIPNGQPINVTTGSGTMIYSTLITAINPGVSVTIDVPSSASGTVTTTSSKMHLSLALGKGWTVTTT